MARIEPRGQNFLGSSRFGLLAKALGGSSILAGGRSYAALTRACQNRSVLTSCHASSSCRIFLIMGSGNIPERMTPGGYQRGSNGMSRPRGTASQYARPEL
jgi:hypothetical protein